MKYLLLSPPKKGVRLFFESPPVGLAYIATTLRNLGHTVDLKDCIIEKWGIPETIDYIINTSPDVLGINVFSTALQSVHTLISEVRKRHFHPMIILGGPHCSGSPEHTLNYFDQADFAFRGESEIPLMEFDEYLKGKRRIEYVKGLIYRQQKKVLFNEPIEYPHIEEFGIPAWDLINPRKYFDKVNVGDKSINVHFSRGCPFGCRFCVKLGTKVRFRPWEHIWSELDMLNHDYGVERFIINDEGFTMFPEKVKEFCRDAIRRGNKYRYFTATGLRLNRVDDDMLKLMAESRFENSFGVGIESAIPRVRQELMNKHLTQEELINGLTTLNRNGFKPVGNFIIGFPGDTRKEIIESVNWACKSKLLWGANFVPFLPLPGSPVVNEMIKSGELPKDWDFSKLNLSMVVYAPKGMTIKELDDLRKWAVWTYNFRWKMLVHYLHPLFFVRAVITFLRIYLPNSLLPKNWKRV